MSYTKIKVDSVEIVILALSVANTRIGRVSSSLCPYDDATKIQIPLVLEDMLAKKAAAELTRGKRPEPRSGWSGLCSTRRCDR